MLRKHKLVVSSGTHMLLLERVANLTRWVVVPKDQWRAVGERAFDTHGNPYPENAGSYDRKDDPARHIGFSLSCTIWQLLNPSRKELPVNPNFSRDERASLFDTMEVFLGDKDEKSPYFGVWGEIVEINCMLEELS